MTKKFTIECTEAQLLMLQHACEFMSRSMEGQLDITLQELCEQAYDQKYHEEHKGYPRTRFAPGMFDRIRPQIKELISNLRELVWGIQKYGSYLYRYHTYRKPQAYWDMYQCMRYAHYLSMDEGSKEQLRLTVMSDPPLRCGDEPLLKIQCGNG